ncbi:nicotinate phosphoribosyltransferase [Stutzerimonas azotifigens]|uniref:Nicotinate phosphoribosyltransferase n=1 Tax=Stutzerimonas azotifigens TaxID=291995 RepID=A0ABR5YWP6_9GAMM|nr:nicotinate phosphoribosyltransferase [Stutzerimonas azotifigens]MBA1272321.1 nicotinate phosphoribosyltransferase [Stutzerimonas azotifigens]
MTSLPDDRIIRSLLDTDFYKLTMMQAILHHYPDAEVEWAFRSRTREDLTPHLEAIRAQVRALADLRLNDAEQAFLESIPFMKPDFIRFLRLFRFNMNYVEVESEAGELVIRLRGPWLHIILFEVPLLAIVSEVRNRACYPDATADQARDRLLEKFDWLRQEASEEELRGFKVADFGTRRRFSYAVQESIVQTMKEQFPGRFVGTSNVHLARTLDLKPMGTMAHEWIMAHQQLGPRLIDSQRAALECWVKEYRGALGTALTDCITMDAFLADFDLYFAKLFDGLRHDSGDPIEWANKAIAHYKRLDIDPMTRSLVFSDGLDFQRALSIYRALNGRIKTSYGIGTQLTCDLPGVEPTNIVIKMIGCNGYPVAKISDSPGKSMCRDEAFLSYLRHVFNVPQA